MFLGVLQYNESIYTEHYEEHGLHGVDNERKDDGAGGFESVEDKDCLDGEVPWACTIGRGHKYCNTASAEGHKACRHAQVLGEAEAVEGKVIMEEVGRPDAHGLE